MSVDAEAEFLPGGATVGRLTLAEVRGDLPAALRLLAILAVAGLPLGALWAVLAPVVHVVTLPGTGTGSPAGETDHAFDAVAVFVLIITAGAVLGAALAWRRRHRRGPVLLVALVVGTLVGAWLAGQVGVLLATGASPVPVLVDPAALAADGVPAPPAPVPATLTSQPASPGPWWLALVAGFAAALTYVLAAIANGHEDMGRDDVVPG